MLCYHVIASQMFLIILSSSGAVFPQGISHVTPSHWSVLSMDLLNSLGSSCLRSALRCNTDATYPFGPTQLPGEQFSLRSALRCNTDARYPFGPTQLPGEQFSLRSALRSNTDARYPFNSWVR
jgi:hypothetical protein